MDLNADIGEGMPETDEMLAPLLTSANIACGGHHGDEDSMRTALELCSSRNIRIGAHPSYPDRESFGRISIELSVDSIVTSVLEQTSALIALAESIGGKVAYIKPHGALYNDAVHSDGIASGLLQVGDRLGLPLMCLAGSSLGRADGTITEGFIDRGYMPDGTLIPRGQHGDLIVAPPEAAAQALSLAPKVDSLCVHSDTPGAPALLAAARRALEDAGYVIEA